MICQPFGKKLAGRHCLMQVQWTFWIAFVYEALINALLLLGVSILDGDFRATTCACTLSANLFFFLYPLGLWPGQLPEVNITTDHSLIIQETTLAIPRRPDPKLLLAGYLSCS